MEDRTYLGFPLVEVAVALITSGGRVMTIYNPRWGAFSLPMTKRRDWADPSLANGHRQDAWSEAGARAAAETLGTTFRSQSFAQPIYEIAEFQQSDSDGKWKRYHFQVFHVPFADKPESVHGVIVEWMPPAYFEDQERRPISPTARHIIAELRLRRIL